MHSLTSIDVAVSHYSYQTPYKSSTNSPYQASNTLVFYITQDPQNRFSLFAIADKVNDGSGGKVAFTLDTTAMGSNAVLLVQDDPAAGGNAEDPADSWYWTNGKGSFSMTWGACCTDGFAIGPIDVFSQTAALNILISITSSTNISNVVFVSSNGTSTYSIPITGSTFRIQRYSCKKRR